MQKVGVGVVIVGILIITFMVGYHFGGRAISEEYIEVVRKLNKLKDILR